MSETSKKKSPAGEDGAVNGELCPAEDGALPDSWIVCSFRSMQTARLNPVELSTPFPWNLTTSSPEFLQMTWFMPGYCAYLIGQDGHIVRRVDIVCDAAMKKLCAKLNA